MDANTQVPAGSRHYAATTVPDRIVASPAVDPGHGFAVAWRTDVRQTATEAQIAVEIDGPLLTSTLILPGEELPMTDAEEIRDRLGKLVDLVIEAGYCGPEATTVIDLTPMGTGGEPEVVRVGQGPLATVGL